MSHPARFYAAARCCVALLGALGAFLPFAQSQTAPAPAATKRIPTPVELKQYDQNGNGVLDADEQAAFESGEKGDGAVVLTPFEVSTAKDRGYAAGNTLSGGRVNTPLALTGASISVMTKEFLDDFALTDINQAAAFTLNMDVSIQPNSGPFGTDRFEANFRGAGLGGTGSYPTRNGIQNYFVADTYNTERFEFARGPNSQMFGPGGPGGMQGSYSKRPRFNNRSGSTTVRADSYGGYRGTLDYNQGFDRVAVRVNVLHQNSQSYLDATEDKQNAITGTLSFKLTPKTELRFEYEKSSEYNVQYRKTWGDNASFWDTTTFNDKTPGAITATTTDPNLVITNAGNFGLSTINSGGDTVVYNLNLGKFVNYGRTNQYQTNGLGYQVPWDGRADLTALGLRNSSPGLPKDFRLGPIDNIADRDNNTRSITLEHRFSSNLFAQFSWTGSDIDPATIYSQGHPGDFRVDVNRFLPDGTPNPNVGKRYGQWTQNSQYQQNGNDEYMAMVVYQFAKPRWWDLKQGFNFNTGYRLGRYEAWDRRFRWMNNPNVADPFSGNNQINFRVYFDNPNPSIAGILSEAAINKINPAMTFRNLGSGFHAFNKGELYYGNLISQTSLFNERLNFSLGFRRDRVKNDNLSNIANGTAANDYQIIMGGTNPKTGQNEAGFHSVLTTYRNSHNADTVAYPFKNMGDSANLNTLSGILRPLGFFVNFSQNFLVPPTGGPLIDGTRPLPPFSETRDYGLRYSMPGGKAYASLTRYETTQTGQLSGMQNTGNIQNIWRNLGYTDDAHFNFGGYRDLADRELSGYEFEFTANPTRNLTFTVNFARPTVKNIAERIDLQKYVAQNIAEWKAGAAQAPGATFNGRTIIDPQIITNEILAIENANNGLTTGTIGNAARKRINLAASYRFTEGKLRGLGVNAGINYRGDIKAGSRDARLKFQTTSPTIAQTKEAAFDYLYVDSTKEYSVGANYTKRFGRYNVRFQLNVQNPFDDDDARFMFNNNNSAYSVINAGQFTNQSDGAALTVAGSNPRMQVLSNFVQLEPRKFIFTTTVSF